MTRRIESIVDEAVARGLVSEAAINSTDVHHPWPVMVVTGFMAWLATIPIIGLLLILSANDGHRLMGFVVVACAVILLWISAGSLFVQYLGAALLVSGIVMTTGPDFSARAIALAGILGLLLSGAVRQAWLRSLLAAMGVAQLVIASGLVGYPSIRGSAMWGGCHAAVAAWLAAHALLAQCERSGAYALAAWIESLLAGAGVTIVAMLAYVSGSTFVSAGLLHGLPFDAIASANVHNAHSPISALAAAAASAWLLARKDMPHKRWLLAAAPAVILLGWFATSLGALILMAVAARTWQRPRLAIMAGVAGLWSIGALYYALEWPLAHKSALLLLVGAILLASTRLLDRERAEVPVARSIDANRSRPWAGWALLVSALSALVLTNVGIWRNEQVLRHGITVFVELEPVDPRSMMQGDYMRLAFVLPHEDIGQMAGFVVARRGDDGVATMTRFHDGKRLLAQDELVMQVVQRGRRHVLVTDAFFFEEGEARRWSGAKYGEFRVGRDGRAILVGLRGPALERL